MPTNPEPKAAEEAKDGSNPDNPGLAATGEFPHSAQQEGHGAGVKEGEIKPKSAAGK